MHRRFQISRVLEQKLFSFGLGPLKEYVRTEGEGVLKKARGSVQEKGATHRTYAASCNLTC